MSVRLHCKPARAATVDLCVQKGITRRPRRMLFINYNMFIQLGQFAFTIHIRLHTFAELELKLRY